VVGGSWDFGGLYGYWLRYTAVTNRAHSTAGDAAGAFVSWLTSAALGPAVVALPVNLAADKLAGAAVRWFKRFRRTDDLSRLIKTAIGNSVDFSDAEFKALRKLLDKEETWSLLAGDELKVRELTAQIAARLSPRDSRTAEDSLEAAGTIARGLLEFAVFELAPDVFQKVVLVRLQQMTMQASALDKALLHLHSDLYARLDGVMDLLKRALELQPGPAGWGEITIYLQTLAAWLNTDPWPRDQQLGGHVLTPAAIERKLRVTGDGQVREQDLDVDDLAKRCQRLVILGGPGSGKTWLAKRVARICAEGALQALAADMTLDEVELPLYITCSQLISARGDIREAAVSSALELIGDLGGSRITRALREFFTERNASTLLVIDSLDETSDASVARERLRQADSLRPPWRVVLTSRPSSWDHQLSIEERNPVHRVGELQPLRYPDDVESAIHRWFADKPERGEALVAQIARRPSLQQAATVPLILAFYCILGGDQPLPEFRHELYKQVINRMLRGRWRSSGNSPPDISACRTVLRTWAWRGAKNHQVSGVGQWEDDILTKQAQLSPAGQHAVDHVAAPRDLPDYDTDKTSRRFVHRSIREHLVAERVARMPTDKAVKALLPHLWYDPDWEYAAPAAIAMHPKRDHLLQDLTLRAARSAQIPTNLSVIDANWEFRGLLARIADDSSESDWSTEMAEMIGLARLDLARSGHTAHLAGAAWETSNRLVREELLGQLADRPERPFARNLISLVAQLASTSDDRRQARNMLLLDRLRGDDPVLHVLSAQPNLPPASWMVGTLAELDPADDDTSPARGVILQRLARDALLDESAEVKLARTVDDNDKIRNTFQLLAGQIDGYKAKGLVAHVVQLAQTADDRRQVREGLLDLLAAQPDGPIAIRLVGGVAQLAPTAGDKRQARRGLFDLLTAQPDGPLTVALMDGVVQLAQTADDRRQARDMLLGQLPAQPGGLVAEELISLVVQLASTADDERDVRNALLGQLAAQPDGWTAAGLVHGMIQLVPMADEMRRARDALLRLLAARPDGSVAERLVREVVQLNPTADDKRQTRDGLVRILPGETHGRTADRLVRQLFQLNPTPDDKRQACDALLRLLAARPDGSVAERLAAGVVQLVSSVDDRRRACDALLSFLVGQTDSWAAEGLVLGIVQLVQSADEKDSARDALLRLLADQSDSSVASALLRGVVLLGPTARDLSGWRAWAVSPPTEFLAEVRRNSALGDWLVAILLLAPLSSSPAR
jgi:NACHT domain